VTEAAPELPPSEHGWELVSLSFLNGTLEATLAEQVVIGPPARIRVLGQELPPSTPIGTTANSRVVRVVFPSTVLYRVVPEPCAAPDPYGEPIGNPKRYERSAFLDTYGPNTGVSALYGPNLEHYCLITESFVLDVLCRDAPALGNGSGAGA
jgi:hypothetical protein